MLRRRWWLAVATLGTSISFVIGDLPAGASGVTVPTVPTTLPPAQVRSRPVDAAGHCPGAGAGSRAAGDCPAGQDTAGHHAAGQHARAGAAGGVDAVRPHACRHGAVGVRALALVRPHAVVVVVHRERAGRPGRIGQQLDEFRRRRERHQLVRARLGRRGPARRSRSLLRQRRPGPRGARERK